MNMQDGTPSRRSPLNLDQLIRKAVVLEVEMQSFEIGESTLIIHAVIVICTIKNHFLCNHRLIFAQFYFIYDYILHYHNNAQVALVVRYYEPHLN